MSVYDLQICSGQPGLNLIILIMMIMLGGARTPAKMLVIT